jgi:DNA replication protein DnaC
MSMRAQTLTKLRAMKLNGMARGYEDQLSMPDTQALPFDSRMGFLVDQEEAERLNRRYQGKLRVARLREKAALEDLDFTPGRGIDKAQMLELASCAWVEAKQCILITGATGVGKTFVACALAHKAMQHGYTARYVRLPRLLHEIQVAKADGSYLKLMAAIARVDVLVMDDWGLAPLTGEQRRDVLELVEDRYGTKSLLMSSQLPVDQWFDVIGDATIADAIMDRIVHGSHRLDLSGGSGRKRKAIKQAAKPHGED